MGSMGLLFVVVMLFAVVMAVGGATTEEKCSSEFQKVTTCLGYATGKAEAPTKECCTSVTDIKNKDPTCLCYVIQQANSGNPQIKNLGIQVSRLLQLSSACKLANASLTDCPKLLNITPSSPDYAIFTNSSSSISTTPAAPTGTTSSPTVKGIGGSHGVKHVPQLAGLVAVATTLALCASPFVEVLSTVFHT